MTTAVIVQARTGSSRLPGKVLKRIGARTVIQEVIARCIQIRGADKVVCAIPDLPPDDVLIAPAELAGAIVVRGSEADVLARYIKAAQAVGAKVVMRITADCPLIDPQICTALLELRAREHADYASNALVPSFPVGLDCEVFTIEALLEADAEAFTPNDREHVTPWLIRAPHLKRANLHSGDDSLARMRWTLDYPEDLEFVRAVYAAMPPHGPAGLKDMLEVLRRDSALSRLNAVHQRPPS